MHPDSRIARAPHVLYQDLDGEISLVNTDTGAYYGLDEVGSHVWHLLENEPTLSYILSALLEQFDVAADALHPDVVRFVSTLNGAGLIVVAEE